MSEKTSPDTVPGLGFKDKEKALETLKNLEGRDPDYQKLAIKGLVGRAKRTLTLTKAEEKVQNIKDALEVFENWLKEFDLNDTGKENRAYLPLGTIESLDLLKEKYNVEDKKAEAFLEAYKSVGGDYKHLRTVASEENEPTWDIVRNKKLKSLLTKMKEEKSDLWKDDLPTKEHLELILWAYSPDANRLKKAVPSIEAKLGKKMDTDSDEKEKPSKRGEKRTSENGESDKKGTKRKSASRSSTSSSSSDEESPKKKSRE
ncbi:uncharacterized protein LOC112904055 [Agrilus planipennis]|uniref:Uncharacterized protein LOC112904055 n=1 Tax=Agrilus planipennis TaxID=224129 RepID=A0A7F5QVD8_AGRPL|nr:uncharacterized protein LOC112904055 [Agrilus planipennis]XP_025829026.1 uncharacterized protein LOC112904055 [Agrilus planipennis]